MSIIQITDLNDPQLDIYTKRSEGQLLHFYEPEEGMQRYFITTYGYSCIHRIV